MAVVKIYDHGGLCCGMTHIYGFSVGPERVLSNEFISQTDAGKVYKYEPEENETALKRFEKAVAAIETARPKGIIEVVLIDYQMTLGWKKVLIDCGFQQVSKSKNSNSGNTIYVWHKITGNQ